MYVIDKRRRGRSYRVYIIYSSSSSLVESIEPCPLVCLLCQSVCLSVLFYVCLSICFSVCMNTHISAIIETRETKFGKNVSIYFTQIHFISNVGCHAHRPRNSII